MKKLILIVALSTQLDMHSFAAQDHPLLMRTPTLNKTHIVFSYAGDLWAVGRDGGEASRLTTGVGREFSPLFSPNGQWIAFTGEYDGNVDVYVMPAAGGVPRRLTYHPGAGSTCGLDAGWKICALCLWPPGRKRPHGAALHDGH